MEKKSTLELDDVDYIFLERDMLSLAHQCRFLCGLHATFQIPEHLFLVMELLPGGDLFHHIVKSNKFTEARAQFYTAQIICALQFLHGQVTSYITIKIGWFMYNENGIYNHLQNTIYRNLKPENVMLTSEGHIKLAAFRLCKKVSRI